MDRMDDMDGMDNRGTSTIKFIKLHLSIPFMSSIFTSNKIQDCEAELIGKLSTIVTEVLGFFCVNLVSGMVAYAYDTCKQLANTIV